MSTLPISGSLGADNITQGEFKTNIEQQRQFIEDSLGTDSTDLKVVDKSSDENIGGLKNFTTSPTVPTPPQGDNTTKVATTEFVLANSSGKLPTSSTDNAIARFDGIEGAIQNSNVFMDDNGNIKQGTRPYNINTTQIRGTSLPFANLFGRANGSGVGISDNTIINGDVGVSTMNSCSYSFSSYATAYQQTEGKHIWFSASSGTQGDTISFNSSMELSNTGVLSTLAQGELIGIVASSLVENGGYIKYSNGLIEQWGYIEDTWTNKTFPIAFPNKCFNIIGVDKDTSGGSITAEILSSSQFRLKSGTGTDSGMFIFYRAIGN